MTKILYLPTGEFLKMFANAESDYNGQRTLIVERSVFRSVERIFNLLVDMDESRAKEVFIVFENDIKIPITEGEFEICE